MLGVEERCSGSNDETGHVLSSAWTVLPPSGSEGLRLENGAKTDLSKT
jgi:hypothetical protein